MDDRMIMMLLVNTMGESILVETLKSAASFIARSGNDTRVAGTDYYSKYGRRYYQKELRECYLFIQGTGLNALIHDYNLSYDPDILRESFNYYVRHAS